MHAYRCAGAPAAFDSDSTVAYAYIAITCCITYACVCAREGCQHAEGDDKVNPTVNASTVPPDYTVCSYIILFCCSILHYNCRSQEIMIG